MQHARSLGGRSLGGSLRGLGHSSGRSGSGGGDGAVQHYLFDDALTAEAAVLRGPAITIVNASHRTFINSAGLLQEAPHQLLENPNMSSQSGDPLLPSGWTGGVSGAAAYEDKGDYWEATITAAGDRPKIINAVTVIADTTYTIGCYVVSHATSTQAPINAHATSGTDGALAAATIASGGEGWYATGFIMGTDTSVTCQFGPGFGSNDTGVMVFNRPFIIKGLLPGVSVGTTGVKLSGPPLGVWIGTDDGDEPLYNQPRPDHNLAGTSLGWLVEPEPQWNRGLWPRDFTNAAWVASNLTPTKDAVGLDGVANSASTLTATAANGTIHQAITLTSAERTFSIDVRRITGTGDIDICDDFTTGPTWVTVTGLSLTDFTRYTSTTTQANPDIGVRIVTDTDVVEVDFANIGEGDTALSRIGNTSAAYQRLADQITFPDTFINVNAGTIIMDWRPLRLLNEIILEGTPSNAGITVSTVATDRLRVIWRHGADAGDRTDRTSDDTNVFNVGAKTKFAFTWDKSLTNLGPILSIDGVTDAWGSHAAAAQTDFSGTMGLGARNVSTTPTGPASGHYQEMLVYNTAKSQAFINSGTS